MLGPSFFIFFCYYPDIIQIIPDFLWVFLEYRSKVLVDYSWNVGGALVNLK